MICYFSWWAVRQPSSSCVKPESASPDDFRRPPDKLFDCRCCSPRSEMIKTAWWHSSLRGRKWVAWRHHSFGASSCCGIEPTINCSVTDCRQFSLQLFPVSSFFFINSKISCSLTRNITSHSIKSYTWLSIAYSDERWLLLSILTDWPIHFSL